ncbi:MAG: PadR family transcriptional regulator [Solirubrobacterales bacterium]|nr:PadR family transcriptional regulator [Solirubrobacterales bacterium]
MVRPERYVPYATLPSVSSPRLTETSYIVLGMLDLAEPASPYDLKQFAQLSTNYFWSVPHTQLYTECARLADEGLLDGSQEQGGRRRRTYSLTASGREALDRWRETPSAALYELRDIGTLKLFFGGDPALIAAEQLAAHEQRLKVYEEMRAAIPGAPRGQLLALDCGIGHEREFIRFWSGLLAEG